MALNGSLMEGGEYLFNSCCITIEIKLISAVLLCFYRRRVLPRLSRGVSFVYLSGKVVLKLSPRGRLRLKTQRGKQCVRVTHKL